MKIILNINNNYGIYRIIKKVCLQRSTIVHEIEYIKKNIFKKELLKIINTWKDDEIIMLNYKIYKYLKIFNK